MPVADSEAFFKDHLKKQKLYSESRWANMKGKGWTTMTSYAFAWGHIENQKVIEDDAFKEVIAKIEGFTWGDPNTYPRITGWGAQVL